MMDSEQNQASPVITGNTNEAKYQSGVAETISPNADADNKVKQEGVVDESSGERSVAQMDSGCVVEHQNAMSEDCTSILQGSIGSTPDKDSDSSGESSPVSSKDQDSGVSPDADTPEPLEVQSEETPESKQELSETEQLVAHVQQDLPISECAEAVHAVPSSGPLSPEGSGGVSETQLTVSDLDSPTSPTLDAEKKHGVKDLRGEEEIAGTTGGATCSVGAAASTKQDEESVYYIKWILFGGISLPIITQNENGPCPLLALLNVLLLKGKVSLAPMLEMITSEQLMTYLGEYILENSPKDLSETTLANYEQNMQDAMGVMHKLQTGLDVNVKFTSVRDFEYTPELIVFDLLGISLFHGWLVDPQDKLTVEAVNQCSYNQLVEKIISLKQSDKEDDVIQALTAEQFLDRSASQLTYYGLAELSAVVKEQELCVFFRNNHFNTLYRHNNELFLLVTDQGFLTESNVVWETLSNVEGDCHFTDATFRTYTKPAPSTEPILADPNVVVNSPEQIDHDYQVALFLQEEAAAASAAAPNTDAWQAGYPKGQTPSVQADHDLAMRLQEEENRREAAVQAQQAAAQPAPGYQYPHQQLGARSAQQQPRVEAGGATARRRGAERRGEKEDKSCVIL